VSSVTIFLFDIVPLLEDQVKQPNAIHAITKA
jgi:hypothetical protein